MNVQIQTLKAEIAADLKAIAEIYDALTEYDTRLTGDERVIVLAYYLHTLYCAFERIFQRVASVFGNQIADRSGWHAGLLRRMTLDIDGVRPRLLSDQSYDCLDELRRFRHLFRSAYRMRLDAERLALAYRRARVLERIYRADIEQFLAFLDGLIRVEGE